MVEQEGVIKVFKNDSTTQTAATFLDISSKVAAGGERGLLGLAFHPDYESNGSFYINYTTGDPLKTVISRFQVSAGNPSQAQKASETVLLTFQQPFGNHNGGQLQFGPNKYLYIATGDGGSGGDPMDNGQSRKTLLGKILRIDVNDAEDGKNYAIPPDNPFAGNDQGFQEEIYAYGLRNPWRFSFDVATGQLWAGDVGQNQYEEIDRIEKGGNYGWNIMEGNHCYDAGSCDQFGLILPVWEYEHTNGNRSITGGFVYRGPTLGELTGWYIYADYVSGRIWALDLSNPNDPNNILIANADFQIPSFGIDAENELYICGFDGKIYHFQKES